MASKPSSDEVAKSSKAFIFQCNSDTYLGCIEKGVFGSDKPWPLQIVRGDYCLLHHYDAGALFGLWRAESNGGRNLVPKVWGGRYPNQVKVAPASPKIIEVPENLLAEFNVDPSTGRFDCVVEEDLAQRIIGSMQGPQP